MAPFEQEPAEGKGQNGTTQLGCDQGGEMAVSLYPCRDQGSQQLLLRRRADDPGSRHCGSQPLIPRQPRCRRRLNKGGGASAQRLEKVPLTTLRLCDPAEIEGRQCSRRQCDCDNEDIIGRELHLPDMDRKISVVYGG